VASLLCPSAPDGCAPGPVWLGGKVWDEWNGEELLTAHISSETVRKGDCYVVVLYSSTHEKTYLTDLSGAEWSYLEPHLPTPKPTGRPRTRSPSEILDAIFYIPCSDCAWRFLPHDFPPWKTVQVVCTQLAKGW
jgi:hypothetical protein